MYVLGIESSANKLGIGILQDAEILANRRKTYITPPGTGFVPKDCAKHHKEFILSMIVESLEEANVKIQDIDLFCCTKGPGIGAMLEIGMTVARTLANMYGKPLVPVNHCVAHIEMGIHITKAVNPVVLYVSGGNTQVILKKNNRYAIVGETQDTAVGNVLDKFARCIAVSNDPSPGYNIEQLAKEGKKYIQLPYSVKGMDMCFSGIYSHIAKIAEKEDKKDLCYSLEETIFCMLVEVTERALSLSGLNEVLIVGGVGCNERLKNMMKTMLDQRGGTLHGMDDRYCVDNGAMIAYTGYLMHTSGLTFTLQECDVDQRFRTDSVLIKWKSGSK